MAQLSINLSNVEANYELLKDRVSKGCEVSSVVKSNAYGLGVSQVAKTLKNAGCTTFFVATLPESIELRMVLGDSPAIVMLNGYDDKDADIYIESDITPVLNDMDQINAYKARAKQNATPLPAIAHIDTGMNRLGIRPEKVKGDLCDSLNMRAIMSHFVSSEEKENLLNKKQDQVFQKITSLFPNVPKSLCNSAGIFLSESYHYDLVRPGMALYGLNPTPYKKSPTHPVAALHAKILQIREVQKDKSCGYSETHRFNKRTKVATVDIGYADGLSRHLSNNANLYWNNIVCPIRGNVSMDLTIIDLSNIPENQLPVVGDMVEVIGSNQSADDLAKAAGTIGYEILTSLSHRFERKYINP